MIAAIEPRIGARMTAAWLCFFQKNRRNHGNYAGIYNDAYGSDDEAHVEACVIETGCNTGAQDGKANHNVLAELH